MSMAFLERRRQSVAGAASWSAGAAGACSRERPRVSDAGAEGHVGLCMRWSGGIACHRISQLRYPAGANQTDRDGNDPAVKYRSEEHTSELQSLMRNSYAVFCLKKKITYHHKKAPTSYAETPII